MKKTEVTIESVLNGMTPEQRKDFTEGLVFIDESAVNPIPRVSMKYPILKQALTQLEGAEKVPNGSMLLFDDNKMTHAFEDGLVGIVVDQHKERALINEESKIPECVSYNTIEGSRHGVCRNCDNSQWKDNVAPDCSLYLVYHILMVVDGKIELGRIKAAKTSYANMNGIWLSLAKNVKGKFHDHTVIFNGKQQTSMKDGKKFTYHVLNAIAGEPIELTPESKQFILDVKNTLKVFSSEKMHALQLITVDPNLIDVPATYSTTRQIEDKNTPAIDVQTSAPAGKKDIEV